jgi:hypothetical protein
MPAIEGGVNHPRYQPGHSKAAPLGLPLDLEVKVLLHQATHAAPAVCRVCVVRYGPGGNAVNGECEHGPKRTAERLTFRRKSMAMGMAQDLAAGRIGRDLTRVVTTAEAEAEDAALATLAERVGLDSGRMRVI